MKISKPKGYSKPYISNFELKKPPN